MSDMVIEIPRALLVALDCDRDTFLRRAVEECIDRALEDEDIANAYYALARLDARRNGGTLDRPDAEAVGRPGLCVHAEAEHSRTDGERNLGSAPVGPERDTRSPAPSSVRNRQVADSESGRVDQSHDDRGGVTPTHGGVDVAGVTASRAAPLSSVAGAARLSADERCAIGTRVRAKRLHLGLSQDRLGALLGFTGTTTGFVERGMGSVSIATAALYRDWALSDEVIEPATEMSEAEPEEDPRAPKPLPPYKGESRRRAASVVRSRRCNRGISQTEAALEMGLDADTLDDIERAAPRVSAEDVRVAVAWAQAE